MQDTIEREEKIPIDQVTNLDKVEAYECIHNCLQFYGLFHGQFSNRKLSNCLSFSFSFYDLMFLGLCRIEGETLCVKRHPIPH